MSTQIGPGLRDYLSNARSRRCASQEPHRAAAGDAEQRRRGRPPPRRRRPRSAPSARCSPAASSARSPSAEQLGHRNIISTDVGGTTFLAGLIVDGEPVRATTHDHQPPPDQRARRCEVDAIGSGGGAIAWLDAGGNLQVGPRSAQAVPGPACYGAGRHRADQHRRQPGAGHPAGARPARRAQAAVRELARRGDPHPDRRSRSGCPSRTPPRRSTRCRTRRPATCCARPSSSPATTRAGSCSTPSAVPGPRTARPTPPRSASPRWSSRWARWRRPSPRTGWPRPTSSLAAELSDPTPIPFDPARAERNFAELEDQVRDGPRPAGRRVRPTSQLYREIDMRYTMQLAEVATPVPAGALDDAAIEAAAAGFETRYAELYGEGTGFREAGIQAITFRVRGVGVLPFSPALPDDRRPHRRRPGRGSHREPAGLPRRAASASSTPRSTTTARCAPATARRPGDHRGADHHRRRARRCRPARSTSLGNLTIHAPSGARP